MPAPTLYAADSPRWDSGSGTSWGGGAVAGSGMGCAGGGEDGGAGCWAAASGANGPVASIASATTTVRMRLAIFIRILLPTGLRESLSAPRGHPAATIPADFDHSKRLGGA